MYANSLGTATFAGKRVIGMLNAGYRPRSHRQDSLPQANSIQQPVASVFGEKNSYASVIIILVSRIASSDVKLSLTAKKLRQTTTPEKEHLKISALDDKKLKIPVIGVDLKGN